MSMYTQANISWICTLCKSKAVFYVNTCMGIFNISALLLLSFWMIIETASTADLNDYISIKIPLITLDNNFYYKTKNCIIAKALVTQILRILCLKRHKSFVTRKARKIIDQRNEWIFTYYEKSCCTKRKFRIIVFSL